MPTFTKPDGKPYELDIGFVLKARPALMQESRLARTRIEWIAGVQFVMEPINLVGPVIASELPSFVKFTAPNGVKIWADAAKATGPLTLPHDLLDSARSSFKIAGRIQYVQEDNETVRRVIKKAGGIAL